jgi:hypothetical protein
MADTGQQATQTIVIDTSQATENVEQLSLTMDQMAVATAEAAKGVTHVGDEYQFASEKLQKWYDEMKAAGLEHNKMVVDMIDGFQNASKAASAAATAGEGAANKMSHAVEGVNHNLHKQKLAFEDIGRTALGEGLGLRQFAQLFGVLGPAVSIAAFALYEYGGELLNIIDPLNEAEEAQARYNSVMLKAADGAAQATIDVEKMNAQFADAHTVEERKKALDEYNKKFGETIGYAKDLNAAEANLAAKTDIYKEIIKQRAVADSAYALQKAKIAEAIKAEAEGETSLWAKVVAGAKQFVGAYGSEAEGLIQNHKKIVADFNTEADKIGEIAEKSNKKLQDLVKQAGGGTGDKPAKEKKEHDNSLEELKRYLTESQKIEENAEAKEITSEKEKYDKLKADLIKHHHDTTELTQQFMMNVSNIHEKFQEQRDAEAQKAHAARDAKMAKEKEEFEKKISTETEKFFEKEQKDEQSKYQKQLADAKKQYDALKALYDSAGRDTTLITKSYNAQIDAINEADYQEKLKKRDEFNRKALEQEKQLAEARKKIREEEMRAETKAVSVVEQIISEAEARAGKNTQKKKQLAIASATIKALQGEVELLAGMVGTDPTPAGVAIAVATTAAIGVDLFETIKKIEAVKVPGGSAGGSGGGAAGPVTGSAPIIPGKQSTTSLSGASIGAIQSNGVQAQQQVKAVVVESDMTNSQSRVAGFRQASSL